MTKSELEEIAALIRDGKATDEQKVQFLKALNAELKDVSAILKKAAK